MNFRSTILSAAGALLLVGCGYYQADPPRSSAELYNVPADANLAIVTYGAVDRLMGQAVEPVDPGKPIMVTSLANIDNLDRSSTLGRLLGDQIVARVAQLGYPVSDVKLRNGYVVNANGEFMLSRDVRVLAQQHSAQAVVVGTYAAGSREVYVSLRLVRLADSRVVSSLDYSLPRGHNTNSLLRAASSTQ